MLSDYRLALGAYLLALLLWIWRPSLHIFRIFAPLGSIAFALYAISRPIQAFTFAHLHWLPGNYLGYTIGALITSFVCLGLAWYLERRMQPKLSQLARHVRPG